MKKIVRWLVLLSTIGMITVNIVAEAIPINNTTSAAISDSFPIYFVPAGYVFSIWGLIYVLMLTYAVYQLLRKNAGVAVLDSIAVPVVVTNVMNGTWLILWHYYLINWSLAAMVVLLAALLSIYWMIDRSLKANASRAFFWSVRVPFSVYLGWISVATIANAAVVLTNIQWDGFGLESKMWAIMMIAVAALLGLLLSLLKQDIAYALVLVWALVGIGVKFLGDGNYPYFAFGAATLVSLGALIAFIVPFRSKIGS